MLRLCSPHALPRSLIEVSGYAQNCEEFPLRRRQCFSIAVGDTQFVSFGRYPLSVRNELLGA